VIAVAWLSLAVAVLVSGSVPVADAESGTPRLGRWVGVADDGAEFGFQVMRARGTDDRAATYAAVVCPDEDGNGLRTTGLMTRSTEQSGVVNPGDFGRPWVFPIDGRGRVHDNPDISHDIAGRLGPRSGTVRFDAGFVSGGCGQNRRVDVEWVNEQAPTPVSGAWQMTATSPPPAGLRFEVFGSLIAYAQGSVLSGFGVVQGVPVPCVRAVGDHEGWIQPDRSFRFEWPGVATFSGVFDGERSANGIYQAEPSFIDVFYLKCKSFPFPYGAELDDPSPLPQLHGDPLVGGPEPPPAPAAPEIRFHMEPGSRRAVFDACDSVRGVERATLDWEFGDGATRRGDCRVKHAYATDGTYRAALTVRDRFGRAARGEVDAAVRTDVILMLGDSFAAGEGTQLVDEYLDRGCRRSRYSGGELAARVLERESSQSSVLLLNVTCAGARVETPEEGSGGLLDSQGGRLPQVQAAQRKLAERDIPPSEVDAVLVGIGGNDIGFADLAKTCLTPGRPCYEKPVAARYCPHGSAVPCYGSAHHELAARYDRLAGCLGSACAVPTAIEPNTTGLGIPDPGRVLLTQYPNLTQGRDGAVCRYLTFSRDEMTYARDQALIPLNASGADAAARHGWLYVDGTYAAAERHGLCARGARWVYNVADALRTAARGRTADGGQVIFERRAPLRASTVGIVHPNRAGQRNYGCATYRMLRQRLDGTTVAECPPALRP
jgi:PKD domain/GDSL-like Lipase/Acylhydrolase family